MDLNFTVYLNKHKPTINSKLQKKIVINPVLATYNNTYVYKRLPLGLKLSSLIFQETMSMIMGRLYQFVFGYFDDLIIISETKEQHLERLQMVFDRLKGKKPKTETKEMPFLKTLFNT